jgi:predicted metalloprotease with PDZ domain
MDFPQNTVTLNTMKDILRDNLVPSALRPAVRVLGLMLLTCCLAQSSEVMAVTLRGGVSQQAEAPPPAKRAQLQEKGIVGLNFEIQPQSYPFVVEVYPGTPAVRAGLRPGDVILSVNTAQTLGMSSPELDEAISDVPGDVVNFVVRRNGQILKAQLTVASLSTLNSRPVRSLYLQVFEE